MAVHEDEYIQRRHVYEEYAYVLDYLPYGRGGEKSRHLAVPTAQIMGEQHFTLRESTLDGTEERRSTVSSVESGTNN